MGSLIIQYSFWMKYEIVPTEFASNTCTGEVVDTSEEK